MLRLSFVVVKVLEQSAEDHCACVSVYFVLLSGGPGLCASLLLSFGALVKFSDVTG